ncbi:MAG: Lrp/AsnC family transcriptional regulator [Methanotrichaceae archaeon]|nr:Lrp/AsnC family transcriptional regulator [Methanotrichaceae archaeon]
MIDKSELELLKAAQDGIAFEKRPYLALGRKVDMPEEEVLEKLEELIDRGVIRRFSATIGHRALGIVANAMIAWRAGPEEVARAGRILASFEAVTHCYERETAPDWPYNLYTVVHSRSREDCIATASELSQASGLEDYRILFSEREYKKTSARI